MKEKYTFNNYNYIKNYDASDEKILIEHGKERPKKIFKFYSLNDLNIKALSDGYFYASHPFELNDYLDSSPFLLYTSKPLNFELYENFFGFLYEDNPKELEQFYKDDISRENLCKEYIGKYWEVTTNILGIISMTGKENNPLMWPHYTNEKGFQLKFDTEKLERSIEMNITHGEYLGLHPINYSEKLSPIDISPYQTLFVPLFYITNIKSLDWQYEDEWRFLISKNQMGVPYSKAGLSNREDYSVNKENRYTHYKKDLIEEITLGMNFFNGREFLIDWLDEKNFKVSPKEEENNTNYKNHINLLTLIVKNFSDKLYYSGLKYELDDNNQTFLIRTKEKLEIKQIEENTFILTRTEIIIKIF